MHRLVTIVAVLTLFVAGCASTASWGPCVPFGRSRELLDGEIVPARFGDPASPNGLGPMPDDSFLCPVDD